VFRCGSVRIWCAHFRRIVSCIPAVTARVPSLPCSASVSRARKSEGSHAESCLPENSLSTSNFSSHRTMLRVHVSKGMGSTHSIHQDGGNWIDLCGPCTGKESWSCPVTLRVCREVLWAVLCDAAGSKDFRHRSYSLVNLLNSTAPSERTVIIFHVHVSYPQRLFDGNTANSSLYGNM
jgi:hypothetical protein